MRLNKLLNEALKRIHNQHLPENEPREPTLEGGA
jgi:hypothetical protein